MSTQITMSRWAGDKRLSYEIWRDLIASLVMAGYTVYADDDAMRYKLGNEDEAREV